jgi:hypothetical protein
VHRTSQYDLDPICKLQYGPATSEGRSQKKEPGRGQHPTTRSALPKILLASTGPSKDVSWMLTPDIHKRKLIVRRMRPNKLIIISLEFIDYETRDMDGTFSSMSSVFAKANTNAAAR